MMVRRIKSTSEVAEIMNLQDDRLEEQVPCSKGEWLQFLMAAVLSEDCGIWVAKDQEELLAYLVAISVVAPPVSKSVVILYSSFFSLLDEGGTKEVLNQISEWGRNCGAEEILIYTRYPTLMETYGFIRKEETPMSLRLYGS